MIKLCPICGGRLSLNIIEETFKYKNHTLTIPNYRIFECDKCEEAIVDNETLKETKKEIHDFYNYVDMLLINNTKI